MAHADVLKALTTAVPVYQRPMQLVLATGQHMADVEAALAELEADGLVSSWDVGAGDRAWLLSSLAVEELGLVLLDDGEDLNRCRWARANDLPPLKAHDQFQSDDPTAPDPIQAAPDPLYGVREDYGVLGYLADEESSWKAYKPSERPWTIEEALAEIAASKPKPGRRGLWEDSKVPREFVPSISLLVGSGRINWTPTCERGPLSKEPCCVCRGIPLKGRFCCLGCLRSAVDKMIGEVKPLPKDDEPPKEPVDPNAPKVLTKLAAKRSRLGALLKGGLGI